jgi:hypothetical protein
VKKTICFWLLCGLMALLTGCATRMPMALADGAAPKPGKVTVLMSADLKNAYKPGWQPELVVAKWQKPGAEDASGRFNFKPDETALVALPGANGDKTYLLSLELEPGKYQFADLTAMARSFPIVGWFTALVMQEMTFAQAGVVYIGNVSATVRERQGDEMRAGPVIPLIDQAVVGASGGTFDIETADRWSVDEALFKSVYPGLAGAQIGKQLMAPHDAAKVATLLAQPAK